VIKRASAEIFVEKGADMRFSAVSGVKTVERCPKPPRLKALLVPEQDAPATIPKSIPDGEADKQLRTWERHRLVGTGNQAGARQSQHKPFMRGAGVLRYFASLLIR